MRNLMALMYYLCALLGCDVGGTVIEHRASASGVDIIDSRVKISEQIARFDCRVSQSGVCHYSLFRGDCAAGAPCTQPPFERFDLAAGATREIVDIAPGFKVCVSAANEAVGADCKVKAQ